MINDEKNSILASALSPYEDYCVGYPGKGPYLLGLVMSIGITKEEFSHRGSMVLDSIVAYDQAEINDTYIGQINMQFVSSFCGPEGLIWGYDIVPPGNKTQENLDLKEIALNFKGIEVKSAKPIREATKTLFGTKDNLNFPLLPGTHVPCAGRFLVERGPIILYCAIAIGIPKNRQKYGCLLMEDVGSIITPHISFSKREILKNAIKSVLKIGRAHRIPFKEVLVDFVTNKVKKGQIGCALVAAPYFLLAKKAYLLSLCKDTLQSWKSKI